MDKDDDDEYESMKDKKDGGLKFEEPKSKSKIGKGTRTLQTAKSSEVEHE